MTTTATDSDLVFDPYDHEIMLNPHPLFRRLREEAPLYYNPEHDFYAVSRFEDIEKVLLTRDVFISRKGVTLGLLKSDWEIPAGTLIFDEPPVHGIHRALLSRMFTPRRVAELEPKIRQLCADLLDPLVGSDGFDFVRDLGSIVPMQVISMLLGIPEEEQVRIRDHFAYQREELDSAEAELDEHGLDGGIFAEFIDARVKNPTDDIMSKLLHAEFEDENGVTRKLSRDELLCYVNIVAAAGNETTRILIGWTGKLLAENPDERRKVVEDLSLSRPAIEEVLRCEPNTLTNCRYSVADYRVPGSGGAGRQHHGDAHAVGRARRPHLPRPRPLRRDARAGHAHVLRLRRPLLPRAGVGPPRRSRRAGRGAEALPRVGRRPRQRALHVPHRQPRLQQPPHRPAVARRGDRGCPASADAQPTPTRRSAATDAIQRPT